MPRLTTIPFEAVTLPHDNVRSATWEDLDVDDLIASIPIVSLLEPLIVRWNGDAGYELVAGFRRHRALHVLGHKGDTPVNCYEPDEEISILEVQLTENLMRQDLRPTERATGLARLVAEGMKQKDVAVLLNMSPATVSSYVTLTKLPPPLFALLDDPEADVRVEDLLIVARTKHTELVERWLAGRTDEEGEIEVYGLWDLTNAIAREDRLDKQRVALTKLQREQGKLGNTIVGEYDHLVWFAYDSCDIAEMDSLMEEATKEHGEGPYQWYTSMWDAERGRLTLLVRYADEEVEAKAEAKAEQAATHEERTAQNKDAEKRARFIQRETQKLWDQAVADVVEKPPMTALKNALVVHALQTSSPISPKRVSTAMGWKQEEDETGSKVSWTDTYYVNRQRLVEEGTDRQKLALLVALFVGEDRSNTLVAACQEASGLPTMRELTDQVNETLKAKEATP